MGISPVIEFKDMDGDGDEDIFVSGAVTTHGVVGDYWIENRGGESAHSLFELKVFQSIVPTAMTWGDLDGDGVSDVVVGHMSGATVFRSSEQWSMENLGVSLASPQSILIEDVNRDGLADIVVRDTRELVLMQNVGGEFGVYSMAWPNLGHGAHLAVGDIDISTSSLEILTLNGESILGMVSHNGKSWQAMKEVSSMRVSSFELVDMNRDGVLDIAIEDHDGHKVWLENDGAGQLTVQATFPENTDDTSLETAAAPMEEERELVYPVDPAPETEPESLHSESKCGADGVLTPVDSPFFNIFATPRVPTPLPAEPAFDYQAGPDLDYESSANSTVDFSDEHAGMHIDLASGEAYQMGNPCYCFFYGGWFSFRFFGESWEDTDSVVNAIGTKGADDLFGNEHDNVLDGGRGNDWLFGGGGDDTLIGGKGYDYLFGEDGDDLLSGGMSADILFGDGGNDLLYGDRGHDYMVGGRGEDTLLGGTGNDVLIGGSGDDALYGGLGIDILEGGKGSDIFHYVSVKEGGDTLTDFASGEDVFEFEFGSGAFFTVDESYEGVLDAKGDAFVWETHGGQEGDLYYDPNVTVTGDETLIASVTLDTESDSLSAEDISIV